ncbi:MAG: isochorismatase family protein, partial [Deltaproteobacteria bacterium]|nr:isochorismatase family protein [Deltaproteobacteria bacterium]
MSNCLVMVDVQNDYFPGGTVELVGIEDAADNARILLTAFRKTKSTIIHIQHISIGPEAFFFLPETDGAKINDRVSPREGEAVVVKNYPNSFRDTSLLEILRNAHID